MPYKPKRPCSHPGCPKLSSARFCPQHQAQYDKARDKQRGTSTERGYDVTWRRVRAQVLRTQPICPCGRPATEVHHRIALSRGGTHHRENLLPLCGTCHRRVTAAQRTPLADTQFIDRTRDLSRRVGSVVIHVCGAPASGKSYLSRLLATECGLPTFGIDDERRKLLRTGQAWRDAGVAAWDNLEAQLDRHSPCIVETSGRHSNDGPLLAHRRLFRVLCVARDQVRMERLAQRVADGYWMAEGQRDYVARLMSIPAPSVRADVVWDSSASQGEVPSEVVAQIAAFVGEGQQGNGNG